jgi:hypothetical protein
MTANDPLKPSPSLLCKLGSVIVHVDELLSPSGHVFDREALKTVLQDAEVQEWLNAMNRLAFLPVKR